MKYKLKNISGSTLTIVGQSVADGEFFEIVDDAELALNKIASTLSDAPNLTQLFRGSGLQYYEDDDLKLETDYWREISKMQVIASVPLHKWVFRSEALNAQSNQVKGYEYFEMESTSSGWKSQKLRVQLRQQRSDIPVIVVVGEVEYVNTNGLEVGTITSEWFDVEFNAKGNKDGLTCSVAFEWEATYDS